MKQLFAWILCYWALTLFGQDYQYDLSWDNPSSHLYQISLTADAASGDYTDFQIPAWRPGRYIIQDYAAAVSQFAAKGAEGKSLNWTKIDNDTWRVQNGGNARITISYAWYANVMDAGSSVLNREQAYFNGSNLFMHVRDRYAAPCTLTVSSLPQDWKTGTALHKTDRHNVFTAPDYHEFVDAPTILSPTLLTLKTEVDGAVFYAHFQGNFLGGKETQESAMADINKIIREQKAVFGEMPLQEYHFLYQLLPYNMRHAVEHSYSSCFTLPETVTKSPDAIKSMYGITSHEFWHLWNVKRIRPAALWPYNYQQEAYTRLHWFTEGVTEYYTNLILVRAGLMDREKYLEMMAEGFADLDNTYANSHISPEQSSFDSWLARSNYSDPHLRTSYYPQGERVGLLLDLKLRMESDGKVSLDDVFRYLNQEYFKQNRGVPEDGIQLACEKLTGKNFKDFFAQHVAGTQKPEYDTYLATIGMELKVNDGGAGGFDLLGVQRAEDVQLGVYLRTVSPGSDAAKAGLGDGDLVMKIDGKAATADGMAAVLEKAKPGDKVELMVFAGGESKPLTLTYSGKSAPKAYTIEQRKKNLKEAEQTRLDEWLGSKQK